MKESAQIALSYLRSHGAELELPVGDLKDRGVHVHVPAGAVPKDGPSAGVTMTTALASLLSGRLVRSDVAMTGEVSLTGRVLPIGGVKQKLLAAHRAGITTVLIPKRNEPDLDDVPAEVRAELEIHPVSDVREVLELALEPADGEVSGRGLTAGGRPGPAAAGGCRPDAELTAGACVTAAWWPPGRLRPGGLRASLHLRPPRWTPPRRRPAGRPATVRASTAGPAPDTTAGIPAARRAAIRLAVRGITAAR